MTSWRVKVTSFFLKELEISIHTFTRRELWKHKWNMTCITWTTKYYDDMTWFMTICHHVTYVTYVTWRQGMTSWAQSFISDFFYMSMWVNWSDDFTIVSHGIYVMKFITAIVVCVTSTRDLETEGHVMVYVIFVISACICPTALIFFLFRKVFRSRNSFQLLPIAWPSRVTLNLKVTAWTTWLWLSLLVFVLQRWFFRCFVRVLGHGIQSNYCQLRDLNAWPWILRLRHGLTKVT